MNPGFLWKPEYAYRPLQLFRRLRYRRYVTDEFATVALPWGMAIRIRPTETIGKSLLTLGIYELLVSEVLWRLTDPDDSAADVGANIGYMTALLSNRARSGKVWAFEPHPEVFAELEHNLVLNSGVGSSATIATNAAVSDRSGTLMLVSPEGFAHNRGLSNVTADRTDGGRDCRAVQLDDVFPGNQRLGIVKIDVEGHERNVLIGGARLFGEGRVRDCLLESHELYPNAVTEFLEGAGYSVFGLEKQFRGPALTHPSETGRSTWEPASLLATRDPERARTRLAARGWHCLRRRGRI